MNLNFNFFDAESSKKILNQLELQMASIQEIIAATKEQQTLIGSTVTSINALIAEVRQLLSVGNVAEADAFLAEIQANSLALAEATVENTEVAALVDAVNGDPESVE